MTDKEYKDYCKERSIPVGPEVYRYVVPRPKTLPDGSSSNRSDTSYGQPHVRVGQITQIVFEGSHVSHRTSTENQANMMIVALIACKGVRVRQGT
jgi:hypothetical protein